MKLIDFGLATKGSQRPAERQLIGTPGYIAPELLMHHSFDQKVDIYSCGIVLYFMLAGTSPFSGVTVNEVLDLNQKNKIKFDKFPWISKEARTFIAKLTNTNPYFRPTATEALQSEWLVKSAKLAKEKGTAAAKTSTGASKLDSYSFYKCLAREIPNEFTDSCESSVPRTRRTSRLSMKVNRVPNFEAKGNRLSYDKRHALKSTQFKKFPQQSTDSFPLYKFVDNTHLGSVKNNLSNDGSFNDYSLNRISDSTSSDPAKAKSTFALKAQQNAKLVIN